MIYSQPLRLQECKKATCDFLDTQQKLGYRVSAKKAQLCTREVSYLGYKLYEDQRWLSRKWIQAVLQIPPHTTKRQICEFLGAAGYYHLWILGFTEIARLSYEATKGRGEEID